MGNVILIWWQYYENILEKKPKKFLHIIFIKRVVEGFSLSLIVKINRPIQYTKKARMEFFLSLHPRNFWVNVCGD